MFVEIDGRRCPEQPRRMSILPHHANTCPFQYRAKRFHNSAGSTIRPRTVAIVCRRLAERCSENLTETLRISQTRLVRDAIQLQVRLAQQSLCVFEPHAGKFITHRMAKVLVESQLKRAHPVRSVRGNGRADNSPPPSPRDGRRQTSPSSAEPSPARARCEWPERVISRRPASGPAALRPPSQSRREKSAIRRAVGKKVFRSPRTDTHRIRFHRRERQLHIRAQQPYDQTTLRPQPARQFRHRGDGQYPIALLGVCEGGDVALPVKQRPACCPRVIDDPRMDFGNVEITNKLHPAWHQPGRSPRLSWCGSSH